MNFLRLAVLTLLTGVMIGCMGRIEKHPNILFITCDTTRTDHLGAFGYPEGTTPNLDLFSKDALRFSNAVTVMPLTTPSHMSIFTSLYPASHKMTQNFSQPPPLKTRKLAEILKENGYDTAAFVSSAAVGVATGLNSGLDVFNGPAAEGPPSMERPAPATARSALSWLERRKDQKPFFLWVHFYDPHFPYDPPASFIKGAPSDEIRWTELKSALISRDFVVQLDESDRSVIRAHYDGEIRLADEQIGLLLQSLKDKGLYDDTVIIFMSDHGEILGESADYYGHNCYLYDGSLKIPLLMKFPGIAPRTVGSLTSTLDVLPTLLDYLNISDASQGHFEGQDLLPYLRGKRTRKARSIYIFAFYPKIRPLGDSRPQPDSPAHSLSQNSYQRGIRTDHWKYWKTNELGEESSWLFDLAKDPGEKTNVAGLFKDVTADFERQIAAYEVPPIKTEKEEERSDPDRTESLKQLKSLGYL